MYRRAFIKNLAALGLASCSPMLLGQTGSSNDRNGTQILASAATDKQGQHWLALYKQVDKNLKSTLIRTPLPDRAHDVALQPQGKMACAVARRPGYYLLVVDTKDGSVLNHIEPETGFHFYGHGLFSHDGRYFLSCENHIDSGEGYIIVRDCNDQFAISQRFPSYGIGPHQLKWMPDNKTLVVANGGIRTHPHNSREKLNLETMKPSLAYINVQTGALTEQRFLPAELHQLSIRHIDVSKKGEVFIGMQYQGEAWHSVPLLAWHNRGQALQTLWANDQDNPAMKNYCGSVCYDRSGKYAAASAPKGNFVAFWDMHTKSYLGHVRNRDACGLASLPGEGMFFISNGAGKLQRYSVTDGFADKAPEYDSEVLHWDNHLNIIG